MIKQLSLVDYFYTDIVSNRLENNRRWDGLIHDHFFTFEKRHIVDNCVGLYSIRCRGLERLGFSCEINTKHFASIFEVMKNAYKMNTVYSKKIVISSFIMKKINEEQPVPRK